MTGNALPAVMVAMAEELAPYRQAGELQGAPEAVGGATFAKAEIGGRPVLLVRTGIGLVNAASGATTAITKYGATALISAGSAGGMSGKLQVGGIVVGDSAAYSMADATSFEHKYVYGQVPGQPAQFTADPALVAAAQSAAATATGGAPAHTGLIISGDAFVSQRHFHDFIAMFPDALAADMETAALAQVANLFGVPWLAVRSVSDMCGPLAAGDFAANIKHAAGRSADVVLGLLRA